MRSGELASRSEALLLFAAVLVSPVRCNVSGVTHDIIDGTTAAGQLDVFGKCPLADAPIADVAVLRFVLHAWHLVSTPSRVALPGDLAEVRLHLDADVVRALIVVAGVDAVTGSRESSLGHAGLGARLKGRSAHVRVHTCSQAKFPAAAVGVHAAAGDELHEDGSDEAEEHGCGARHRYGEWMGRLGVVPC